MSEPDRATIYSLQAGRALAALAVVTVHSTIAVNHFNAQVPISPLLMQGYLGVDFFFVLSGFIIYHSTVGRSRTPFDYSWARIRRVYLPYLPVAAGIAYYWLVERRLLGIVRRGSPIELAREAVR